jgi:hypothetical protein
MPSPLPQLSQPHRVKSQEQVHNAKLVPARHHLTAFASATQSDRPFTTPPSESLQASRKHSSFASLSTALHLTYPPTHQKCHRPIGQDGRTTSHSPLAPNVTHDPAPHLQLKSAFLPKEKDLSAQRSYPSTSTCSSTSTNPAPRLGRPSQIIDF